MSILNLVKPELLNTPNYIPGGDEAKYRLHANELPWSQNSNDASTLNFYPSNQSLANLQEQLADLYQVKKDELVITRGSDDGIDLITRLFLNSGKDAIMQFPPTFPMYAFYARLQQAELIQCPLSSESFSLSMDQIKSCWKPNCKIIMFCSPNNPTGNIIDLELIAATCKQYSKQSMIVVDEAYIEFSLSPSALTLLPKFENLIVLRTLSKAYGMAGLRLGSVLSQPHIIEAIHKVIPPYIIATPIIKLAQQALNNPDWVSVSVERLTHERDLLINQLKQIPLIETVYPTQTNFILVKTSQAKEITAYLANNGIAVRDFPAPSPLTNHLRITVGDEEQNQLLTKHLSTFLAKQSNLVDKKMSSTNRTLQLHV